MNDTSIRFLLKKKFVRRRVNVSVRMHCAIQRIRMCGSVSVTSLTFMLGRAANGYRRICRDCDMCRDRDRAETLICEQ